MIILIGESGSGKSTIEKELCRRLGLSKIVSVTTRPMRTGERNHVDYHFVTEEQFEKYINTGLLAEHTPNYGILKGEIASDKIAVVELKGLNQLIQSTGREHLSIFYIRVSERIRMIRMLQRGDDVDEIMRRVVADRKDFAKAKEVCDHCIRNMDLDEAVNEIVGIVRR